jgi:alpha-beta hydrolase superfamily lysophospholipase
LQAGLELRCAVLIQHSARSRRSGRSLVEADLAADLVLDVEHMKRFAGAVGPRVELQEIEGGLHDLTLSREPARTEAIQGQLDFLTRNLG